MLAEQVLGNPHSVNPSSMETTRRVEQARAAVLDYFGGTGDYTAIFTLNASGALKLVGEAYPFAPGGRLLLTADNHNSVNGIREFAQSRGARVDYAPLTRPELRIDQPALQALLAQADAGQSNLFAFPAQSNFSGVKHPLELVETARSQRLARAAGRRRLRAHQPPGPAHRVPRFRGDVVLQDVRLPHRRGLPAGAQRDAGHACGAPGSAAARSTSPRCRGGMHVLSERRGRIRGRHAELPGAFRRWKPVCATCSSVGIETIQTRVQALTGWLITRLLALKHSNGRPMVRLYGPASMVMRGGTLTLNFCDPNGHLVDYRRIEELAAQARISLRTGCFCNPGAGEAAEDLTEGDMRAAIEQAGRDINLQRFLQVMQSRGGKTAGAIRVSTGLASNFADVERFMRFAEGFRDQTALTVGTVSFDIESCRVVRDGG
jgi:molybdenum cofactor sulfurtransferase